MQRVVIIGGGFGGLYAAKALGSAPVAVTLIDRRNHHVFQPLLYQVATAGLSAIDIGEPIRRILRRQANTSVQLAEVVSVDLEARHVLLAEGEPIEYDYLIVATGAGDSYFGHDDWEPHAPGLKSIEDALEIRRRVLLAFEQAEMVKDPDSRRALLTLAVIGGGPTGAELAGALAELSRHTLSDEFRQFDAGDARVLLIEAGDRILPGYPPALSARAQRQLERLGVEIRTGAPVTEVDAGGIRLGDERIPCRTMLWAAGVAASPLGASLGTELDQAGRVIVEPDLTVPGHPEVFVVGDLAHVVQNGRPLPGVAPAAIQMGRHAADSITRAVRAEPTQSFRYVDRGTMATLGRSSAIAVIKGIRLWGLPAWLAWLFIHILFLIGFRNRAVVLFEWARSYLTYSRSARLILHPRDSD
ncbi:MAG TPA: NAD(P)/FAD-dependent oxidoreductase [Acidimicrobiia bacterium]|nr:NAD(P)/FAD-dependent oxidoreductase [Acidimicrobiia bacterium]